MASSWSAASSRLDRETNETLFAYAHFLGEPTDYVLNQVIDTVLAKDKEFQAWRAEHPESHRCRRQGQANRASAAREASLDAQPVSNPRRISPAVA